MYYYTRRTHRRITIWFDPWEIPLMERTPVFLEGCKKPLAQVIIKKDADFWENRILKERIKDGSGTKWQICDRLNLYVLKILWGMKLTIAMQSNSSGHVNEKLENILC